MTTKPLESFIPGTEQTLFPLQNLPYGIFCRSNDMRASVCVAIGDYILDLSELEQNGLLQASVSNCFNQDSLNKFASLGPKVWAVVRQRIQSLLSKDNFELQRNTSLLANALVEKAKVQMKLPFKIEGFTDFYASENHASNVGRLFRGKENPLLPNWKYLPVAYNGRASTVFLSGTNIKRPKGQIKLPDQVHPIYSPTRKLDFELELGVFIGVGNGEGYPIPVNQAQSHIFGLVLLNDWSARDIQAFEYQPLGPFLSKSFATSISPWVVPLEAFKNSMVPIAKQLPETVDYLKQENLLWPDIQFKVEIKPHGSKQSSLICHTHAKELYWTMEQMLAHHTVNHCIMKPGDLFGSGTISGKERANWGSLLEITYNGTEPLKLTEGQERTFLQDGDTVIMSASAHTEHGEIGFGSLEGMVIG